MIRNRAIPEAWEEWRKDSKDSKDKLGSPAPER
jgi:hypothetical protein